MIQMIAASNNAHKLSEIKEILSAEGIQILSLSEAGLDVDIEENGSTFIENALIKARAIFNMTGQAAIADDSGLEVAALNGEPGVYSARYSGFSGNEKDKMNNEKLKKALLNVAEEARNARFCCAIAAIFPDGREITASGYVYGKIGYEEAGENGFGYDPLFIVDGYNKTMAQIGAEEKNKISHRANALKAFVEKLNKISI